MSTASKFKPIGGNVSISSNRHVMLPKEIARMVPKTHLMSEAEWRSLGVQQSHGWMHYMIHEPVPVSPRRATHSAVQAAASKELNCSRSVPCCRHRHPPVRSPPFTDSTVRLAAGAGPPQLGSGSVGGRHVPNKHGVSATASLSRPLCHPPLIMNECVAVAPGWNLPPTCRCDTTALTGVAVAVLWPLDDLL
ncbi:unnamed protein product [Lampetra fluviatilis]